MKEEDYLRRALDAVERNDDGGVDEKKLQQELAAIIPFDEEAERLRRAKRIIDRRRRPGTTDPDGQLAFPGLGAYAYEPERLIADDDGHLIEQDRATYPFKVAEMERRMENVRRAVRWADISGVEVPGYARWLMEQMDAGRKRPEMVFGVFVRESGAWREGQAEQEDPGEDDAVA